MAFTRRWLKALGLEEEKIDEIIAEHAEVVDALKAQSAESKEAVENLAKVQQELDDLKGKDYKGLYDAEKAAHEALKAQIAGEKTKTAVEAAVKAYYESKGIKGKNLNIAMRGTALDGLELDGDKLKDASAIDALIAGDYASLVSQEGTQGQDVNTPPGGSPGKTAFDAMSLSEKMAFANNHPAEYAEYTK